MSDIKKQDPGKLQTAWTEGYLKSFDGTELFCRFYDPPKPKHTVVILHGYGEHSGRYLKFPDKMKGPPVRLALFDCRGMGNSVASAPIGTVEEYLKDVDAFVGLLRERYIHKEKIILMGHSLGGLVAVEWALANPGAIKRLILSAPFLGLPAQPWVRLVNVLIGAFRRDYIYNNPVTVRHLSHDPVEVAAYRNDPLIKRSISVKFLGSIIDHIVRLNKKETVTLPFPVHVLTAGAERIVDPRAARKLFNRLVATKKEFSEFRGFYHEIFNEEGQNQAFNVLKTIFEECV